MQGTISFAVGGAHHAAATARQRAAAALRRYVPHTVAWQCPEAGAPIALLLPESLSASEVIARAAVERLQLAAADNPDAPDRSLELRYAHLDIPDIEEGIRRLGRCLARYTELASRHASGHPSTLVGT